MGNIRRNWETTGETWGNDGEMWKICKELPLGGFMSHLVSSFSAALPGSPAKTAEYALWANQYIVVHVFSPTHGILCKNLS